MSNLLNSTNLLICGGGILGFTIARELLKNGYEDITIIEKGVDFGEHASGRNSGVLHAGVYYSADTLKARFCLRGNLLLKQYCREKNLPISETGKVIVAENEDEITTLKELYNRAVQNGAKVELINEKQLAEIEPNAKTYEMALYSYYTAVVDPKEVLKSIHKDLILSGKVQVVTGTEFKGIKGSKIAVTNKGEIRFNTFVNAAGAHSDKVAHAFGVGLNYKAIPFKGIYKKLRPERSYLVKGNIYPVPDIRNPFLGVHFTRSVKGDVYLGPTAIPALGRENYGILSGMDLEAVDISLREAILFFLNPKFREVALTEPRKYIFKYFFEDARRLVKELSPEDIIPSEKVGIRPQLVDWDKKELVMDFMVVRDGDSVHILNSISPAFTCSMEFARFVVDNYIRGQGRS